MKKIAIEEHFMTQELLAPLIAGSKLPYPDDIKKSDLKYIEKRLEDMDEGGIDMQVLSCAFIASKSGTASDATAMTKRINDTLYNVVKKYPKRFAGFATIAPQEPVTAANELERAVKNLGFKGTMIISTAAGEYLDNQKYWVIFERAEKLGVPIYLHPHEPSADMIKPFLTYPLLAGSMWGFAAEAGLHAMRLICSGVFDKYPGLKIILGHLGEAIPLWLWRIDNRWQKEKAVQPETDVYVKKLRKNPSQYFRENFYVTTSGMFWPPALQFVCSVLGADRILFAVDYPMEYIKEAVQFIESTPVSGGDKEKICHLNAEKLLGL